MEREQGHGWLSMSLVIVCVWIMVVGLTAWHGMAGGRVAYYLLLRGVLLIPPGRRPCV
jgi:hypothetical protein